VPTSYFALVWEMKSAYNHRFVWSRMLASMREAHRSPVSDHSANRAQMAPPLSSKDRELIELSPAPHHQPRKTLLTSNSRWSRAANSSLPSAPAGSIGEFELPLSHRARERIWRQPGQKRRRKCQRKQDLAHIKATWLIFQQISADPKDLDDIPRYWPCIAVS
jgi:hypothetical protein